MAATEQPILGGEPEREKRTRFVVMAGWDDVPHLTEEMKAEESAGIPPNEADARKKGIPSLGQGAIYPVPESEILCDPFVIPDWMPQLYSLDVGWKRTAALWGAWDRDSDVIYLYSEHYRGQAEPAIHAQAIRARGLWIPGVIDPAARGRSQVDGRKLITIYRDELGLQLIEANNALEAGIVAVWQRLSTGRLKVFRTLQNWLKEYRFYQRDERGHIKDGQADHLMDDTRYLVNGIAHAIIRPAEQWTTGKQANGFSSDYDPYAGNTAR